jgi:5-methyltetrahydropteroyltriglutamate--homocysteine methyltransferase
MSREKLKRIGLDLPILPTTAVGSYAKPPGLLQARGRHARGEIDAGALRAIEEEATAFWMKTQDDLGIDVPVDGEMYRGDMVAYFAEHLRGFAKGGLVRSYGNRYYHKPVIVGEVRWERPITVDWWRFAQRLTRRPVKGMLTGPYTLMDWSFDEHYPGRRAAALALAGEVRKEVDALVEAGCRLIQVDEPALSVRSEELPVAIEAMDVVTRGVPAYFFTHCCYGAFEFVYPGMLELPVDNFDLELSNSGLDLVGLFRRHPFTKDISFGVVDVHTHLLEPRDLVERRIRSALQVIPAGALWIDPDCGLKTRTVEESIAKLKVTVEATQAVRRELTAAGAPS